MGNWRKKQFESALGVTEYPAGPNLVALAAIGKQKIYVTSPGFDDISQVLSAIGVEHEPFTGDYNCDLFFLNCGTDDTIDQTKLRATVERGGCLYASDLTSGIVSSLFPGCFTFSGSGSSCTVKSDVLDAELRDVIGSSVDVHFDMGSWSILTKSTGDTLVRAAAGTPYAGKPLMVEVDVGRGAVFYTCFHNKAQTSAREAALLKLLVLKQIGTSTHKSVAQVSKSLGVDFSGIRKL